MSASLSKSRRERGKWRRRAVIAGKVFNIGIYSLVGFYVLAVITNFYLPYLNPAPQEQILSYNFDWPPNSNYALNVLAYNGSMHIDLFVTYNGSVLVAGQKAVMEASGGITDSLSKVFDGAFIGFFGSAYCYLPNCGGLSFGAGTQFASINLGENTPSPGLGPVSEIGPVNFTVPIGQNAYTIDWPSQGIFSPAIQLDFKNGTVKQHIYSQYSISISSPDAAVQERYSRIEAALSIAIVTFGFVEGVKAAVRHEEVVVHVDAMTAPKADSANPQTTPASKKGDQKG